MISKKRFINSGGYFFVSPSNLNRGSLKLKSKADLKKIRCKITSTTDNCMIFPGTQTSLFAVMLGLVEHAEVLSPSDVRAGITDWLQHMQKGGSQ